MKILELLQNYSGTDTKIVINDTHDFSTHTYHSKEMAIREYGFYTVKHWTIDINTIIINIQSQF